MSQFRHTCSALAQAEPPAPFVTMDSARTIFLRAVLVGVPVALLFGLVAPILALFGMVAGLCLVPASALELWAERFPGNRAGASALGLFLLFWIFSTVAVALLILNAGYAVATTTEGYGPSALVEGLSGAGFGAEQVAFVVTVSAFLAWVVALASFNRVRRREGEALFDTFIVALASGGSLGALFGIFAYLGSDSLFLSFASLTGAFILVAIATYLTVVLVYAYFWADVINHRFSRSDD